MLNTLIVLDFFAVYVISYFLFTPARSKAGIVLSNNCYQTCSNRETVAFCQELKLKAPFLKLFFFPYILQQLDFCKGRWKRFLLTEELSCKESTISQAMTSERWHQLIILLALACGNCSCLLATCSGQERESESSAGIQVHLFGVR